MNSLLALEHGGRCVCIVTCCRETRRGDSAFSLGNRVVQLLLPVRVRSVGNCTVASMRTWVRFLGVEPGARGADKTIDGVMEMHVHAHEIRCVRREIGMRLSSDNL